jgi:hypothetical protein
MSVPRDVDPIVGFASMGLAAHFDEDHKEGHFTRFELDTFSSGPHLRYPDRKRFAGRLW